LGNAGLGVEARKKINVVIAKISPGKCRMKIQFKYSIKQDRQCTYNVILRRLRTTIVALEKQ
jgi:hypothetical protein